MASGKDNASGVRQATPAGIAPSSPTQLKVRGDAALLRAGAHFARGVSLWNEDRRQEAIAEIDAALALNPDFAEALCMGGYILAASGQTKSAMRFYKRAIELKSDLAVAFLNLGKLQHAQGQTREALGAFQQATRFRPDDADGWNCLAATLRDLGRLAESLDAAKRALHLSPRFQEASINLGNAHLKLDRLDEALAAYRLASAQSPDLSDALCGQALALSGLGYLDESLKAFEAAEKLGCVEATSGKGCLHLKLGDFEKGWEGYEARWVSGRSLDVALGVRFPRWSGSIVAGERVLVMNDHGLGDTIQFFRYVQLMAAAGVEVTFLVPEKMHRLLVGDARIRLAEEISAEATFNAQIPLSSLPRAFGTRLETIPARVPYIHSTNAGRERWARRIGAHGLKIGIIWQGNANPEADLARSVPLSCFAPLARIPGARLISLQKGFGTEQLADLPPGMLVETLGDDFDAGDDAFVDSRAVIDILDLIVTCDTSMAHLAGALGAPVWVALKKDAEWRWLQDRDDSPWYPTMRLFRQDRRGEWDAVFERMATSAASFVSRGLPTRV